MSQFNSSDKNEAESQLLTTFFLDDECYGIDVMKIQEVTGSPTIIPVPLAPKFVLGLINLRGQLATALGLKELFGGSNDRPTDQMSVVCRSEGNLVSLIVDRIGDVVEVEGKNFEPAPDTLPPSIKRYIKGIYKMDGKLLSVLDLDKITKELSPTVDLLESRI